MNPYPWQLLDRVQRSVLMAGRQLRSHVGADAQLALQRWAASCLGGLASVSLSRAWPGDELATRQRITASVRIALVGPVGEGALLALDSKVAGAIIGALLGVSFPPGLAGPSALERGLLEFALAGLLAELTACPWSVVPGPPPEDHVGRDAVFFEARVRCGTTTGFAWLAVDRAALCRPGGSSERPWPASRQRRLAHARIEGVATLGGFRLPLAEVTDGGLEVGDTILSPTCPRAGADRGALCFGRGFFPVAVAWPQAGAGGGRLELRVNGAFVRGGSAMCDPTEEREKGTVAEEIAVEVVVEIGRVQLSGAQVMALGEGDVITLERPVGTHVDLCLGGQLFARGELVDVDGEAGVRLVEVFS